MATAAVNINDKEELEKAILRIDEYVKTAVSEARYEHSVRTAQTAQKMCSIYGQNPRVGYLAGIAHDMCKECPSEELFALVHDDGMPVSILEQNRPSLLHGRAAAVLIQKKFGVKDRYVVEAIANHTFAAPDLCDLGKILFAADKIEPGRPQSTQKYRDNLFSKSLDELTLSVLEENIAYLEQRGKTVARPSLELAAQLKAKLGDRR